MLHCTSRRSKKSLIKNLMLLTLLNLSFTHLGEASDHEDAGNSVRRSYLADPSSASRRPSETLHSSSSRHLPSPPTEGKDKSRHQHHVRAHRTITSAPPSKLRKETTPTAWQHQQPNPLEADGFVPAELTEILGLFPSMDLPKAADLKLAIGLAIEDLAKLQQTLLFYTKPLIKKHRIQAELEELEKRLTEVIDKIPAGKSKEAAQIYADSINASCETVAPGKIKTKYKGFTYRDGQSWARKFTKGRVGENASKAKYFGAALFFYPVGFVAQAFGAWEFKTTEGLKVYNKEAMKVWIEDTRLFLEWLKKPTKQTLGCPFQGSDFAEPTQMMQGLHLHVTEDDEEII